MYTLRRWWDRHRLQILLGGTALGFALILRQTGAGIVFETYQLLTRPFQKDPVKENLLDNAKNDELQQRLTELESQNQKLRELAGYIAENKKPGIPSPVVGRSADHWWHQLILGRGRNDGIKEGDVVMAPGGVVGRIVGVTSNTSRVLLLSDPSSRVGATISRTRYMGYLRGQSSSRAVMEFFDKAPDVRKGDVVSTSAFSQLYPAGMPIGRVESVNLNKSPAPEATIELTAPVSFLEWAVVYPYSPPPQSVQAPNKSNPESAEPQQPETPSN
jgi:rod shape-determining protein MreC